MGKTPKVFIDGKGGVVGARLYEQLSRRGDLEFLLIDPEKRRDVEERRKLLNEADLAILCLPEETAAQAVELVDNPNTRIIDTSPAHRTTPGWVRLCGAAARPAPAHPLFQAGVQPGVPRLRFSLHGSPSGTDGDTAPGLSGVLFLHYRLLRRGKGHDCGVRGP